MAVHGSEGGGGQSGGGRAEGHQAGLGHNLVCVVAMRQGRLVEKALKGYFRRGIQGMFRREFKGNSSVNKKIR